jgi:hypothetical protein
MAVFGFIVGFSTSFPQKQDEYLTYVTVVGEDFVLGVDEAMSTAIAAVEGDHRGAVVTSVEVIHFNM